jgi:hypothetical protein
MRGYSGRERKMAIERTLHNLQASIEPRAAYARLGLTHNPFPAAGLAPDAPKVEPFPEIRDEILGFLVSFLRTKESVGMVILGSYGTGKTYHLKYMQTQLEALKGTHIKTVFLDSPGLEPYDLIRGVIAAIGEEELAKGVWAMLVPNVRRTLADEGQPYFHRFLRDKTVKERDQARRITQAGGFGVQMVAVDDEALSDHRKFLKAFDGNPMMSREKLRDHLSKVLLDSSTEGVGLTSNAPVARHLASVCLFDGAPALESWEKLTTRSGSSGLFPPEGEPQFLQAILQVLLSSGYEYFVLLLDEFEKVPDMELMTSREARKYLDTVRMLIDKSWETLPFAYVIGSVEAGWRLVEAKLDQALADRFPRKIHLPRLDREDFALYLITEHLNQARVEGASVDPPIHPFPSSLLELVPLTYRRTPRQLLVLCYQLIERAVASSESVISEELVSEYLTTRRLEAAEDEPHGT